MNATAWEYFSVCRYLGAPDFSNDNLETAKLIVPHVKTALEVQGRLEAADLRTQGVVDAITQLNVGVICSTRHCAQSS